MKIEVLVSVMNRKNQKSIVDELGISNDECVIINQVTDGTKLPKDDSEGGQRFYSYKEQGLSKSRNHALDNAKGDICCLCDDDCCYDENYKAVIEGAYGKYKDADIITFDCIRANKTRKTMHGGKVGFLRAMKMASIQVTFKRTSIKKSGIRFDERFGTGSGKYNWGEENIFLFDCIRAGLKIYHVPVPIITIRQDQKTTWDKSSSPLHYEQQGAIYYRMSSRLWRVLALQYIIRKRKLYEKVMSGTEVYKCMVKGAKLYKKEYENG